MSGEKVKIFVTDTGPLITLAAAQSLDYLLYPALPIIIPDAVFYEATAAAHKLGAQEIFSWQRLHADDVKIEFTRIFAAYMERVESTGRPEREPDMGERASLELLRETALLGKNEKGLFLFEDGELMTKHFITPDRERVIPITTHDLLKLLEEEQRIQSADYVLEQARAAGRNLRSYELFQDHPQEIRDAVRETILAAHRDRPKANGTL